MAKKSKSAKKSKRKLIGLVGEVSGQRTYYTTKNTQNTTEPLVLKKYNPKTMQHETYKETKKNLGRNEVKARKS